MNRIVTSALLVVLALCLLGVATTPTVLGSALIPGKPAALPTCSADNVGAIVQRLGGAGEGRTKLCYCGSDGAGTPAYAWCSLAITGAAAVVCAGGSSTVCP